MTLCDPQSYPQNPCTPDSDTSASGPVNRYAAGYPTMQFVTGVPASECGCQRNGNGCPLPPPGAAFYPFYALSDAKKCSLTFGNDIKGSTTNDFGGVKGHGTYDINVPYTFQSGEFANPCIPA